MFYIIKDITDPTKKREQSIRIDDIDTFSPYEDGKDQSVICMKNGTRYIADIYFHHLHAALNREALVIEAARTYVAPSAPSGDPLPARPGSGNQLKASAKALRAG